MRDQLASASQWLQAAGSAARQALDRDPVQIADTELLRSIPAAIPPQRHRLGRSEESVTELCEGITVSASRLRAAIRGGKDRARWSPSTTSGGWQWMAQAAAITSHLSELTLRSLATRAGQLPGLGVTPAQLENAADRLSDMRTAWQQVDRMWDLMITEGRLLHTPAMTEASDLVLRMGRLVWDNPRWTPARSDRAPRRIPAALAPEAGAINSVVAAAHQAVDAMTRVAMTDTQAVAAADRAGRLYVPTRSLSEREDVPRPFARAPTARYRALQDAYRSARGATIVAAQALDKLTIAARGPSMALALARSAAPLQSHRHGGQRRLEDRSPGNSRTTADMPFGHSSMSSGHAGPLEQALRDRRVFDPVILLRAAAIDDAARRLIIQAGNAAPEPGASDARNNDDRATQGAVELAAQNFPRSPAMRPSAAPQDTHRTPATAPRAESHRRGPSLVISGEVLWLEAVLNELVGVEFEVTAFLRR